MDASTETHSANSPVERFRFDDVVVDSGAHTLERAGQALAVEPKVFETLLVLLRGAGQLVPRDTLLDAVWGHRHVTPGVLTRAIAQLRDVLGDDAHHPRYIQTQHAVGYRFIGELIPDIPEPAGPDPPAMDRANPLEEATPAAVPDPTTTVPAAGLEVAPPPPARRRTDRMRRWMWPGAAMLAVAITLAPKLHWPALAPAAPPVPAAASIAVLPFASTDPGPGKDYFAEGLASEMLDALSDVKGLTVAAPVSPELADHYRRDVKALGRALGVATVLDATVQHEGDRVRINARLSDAKTGYTVWSHSYDHEASGIFKTQADIANQVLRELLQVLPSQRLEVARRLEPTRSAAAFDSYLRGIAQLLRPGTANGNQRAITYFSKALESDAGFARAQAGICRAEVRDFADHHDADAYTRAITACKRAQDMQPDLGVVNTALGELHLFRSEYATATDYYMRAMADPAQRPAAYVGLAIAQGRQGRTAQSLENYHKALTLRPGEPTVYSQMGYQYYLSGDLGKSIESYRRATELAPGNVDFWSYLGGAYLAAGQMANARQALEHAIAIAPNYAALTNLADVEYFTGDFAGAADLNRRAVALDPSDFLTWGNLAQGLLAIPGRNEEARDAFREAATRVRAYLKLKPDDAEAVALSGWFSANLGDSKGAREQVARSEALGGTPAEVALANAQTLTSLGDFDGARKRIATARAAGLAEYRIVDNPTLRRTSGEDNPQEASR